jgi:hypothetical protein
VLPRSRREIPFAQPGGGVHHVADRARGPPDGARQGDDADDHEGDEEEEAGEWTASLARSVVPSAEHRPADPPEHHQEDEDADER